MTVSSTTSRNQYTATSGQLEFPYTFEIYSDDDIVVLKNNTQLTKLVDYTVTGAGAESGGGITLLVGATSGDIITLYRSMPLERDTDYQTSGDFLASEVNNDFDRLWLASQQINSIASRSIRNPNSDLDSINMELPASSSRANRILAFDSTGAVIIPNIFYDELQSIIDSSSLLNLSVDLGFVNDESISYSIDLGGL